MRAGDTAAIQAFNEGFRTLHRFSGDQASLAESLSGLSPQKETALYDALIKSFASFGPTSEGEARYIVLLSDGGDTASVATLEEAMAAARAGGSSSVCHRSQDRGVRFPAPGQHR